MCGCCGAEGSLTGATLPGVHRGSGVRYACHMAQLVYSVITSLDGYVVDASGNFDWAAPDEQVHAFVNDRERAIGTYLYGRRMYDVMKVWQDVDDGDEVSREYAQLWRAADKVVY